jgi:putative transposase
MDRPKTLVIQDNQHLMNVAFYCDANPVRAGIVKHPGDYMWSSYRFYAHGKPMPWLDSITPFDWYLELGSTPKERQRAYRRMCDAYLRREGLLPKPGFSSGYYIGAPAWTESRQELHSEKQSRRSPAASLRTSTATTASPDTSQDTS